ncbi:MAG: multiheme c-type cytochrome [Desulfobacterales bacterium]|nr:multiheme c-type cytochrome [Desulfobacterales bacterium]
MKGKFWVATFSVSVLGMLLAACSSDQPFDVKEIMSKPKAYVGSDVCKMCHLEHYDSWKMTLHSRSTQDAQSNLDVIIADFDEQKIRADLAKLGDKLQVPADQIFIPKIKDIKYTQGNQWNQRYIVEKDGDLYIAPIQYNVASHRWVAYEEKNWDKRPWLLKCGGCHASGVDLEKKTFKELSVSCESCHGKGSWHSALPKTAVFEKRQTILNPAKLTMGVAVQICGSCHNRGDSTKHPGADWPVGYEPGRSLEVYFKSTSYEEGDKEYVYANEFAKGHHQQYLDWKQSEHYKEGVTCTSCHYVHQIGLPPTRSQTIGAGSQQCFECHQILNKTTAHAIHSFANCIGCHMPRIVKSAESGDIHSHVFKTLLPKVTIENPTIPNSCTSCHAHKNADLKALQEKAFPGSMSGW